ncbi:hypothetical protein WA026_007932 [Henosepilachna vigintioctopunctata]|uniref:Ig-like domain-containing protein n=1 Tax=Henosepilachna vigintioctopunctata TaxID=420089 RepID=A0AAW1TJG6_9CUCU
MSRVNKTWSENNRILDIIIIISLSAFLTECSGLRLTNMTVPVIQDPREDMQLYCEFDMGGEELYAVKWYKDDHEFFRYSPAGSKLLQFQVTGINVDLSRTKCAMTACNLVLTELSRTFSSGAYRCEVSTEAPTFRLASQTHNITVAAIPQNNPTIEGMNDRYLVGETIVATCSSGLGDPKPSISWSINGQMVNGKFLKELPQRLSFSYDNDEKIKLRSTVVQLRFPVEKPLNDNRRNTILFTCVQSTEILGNVIGIPRNITKAIRVSTEEESLNNQKLYGFFGSASTICPTCLIIVIASVMWSY